MKLLSLSASRNHEGRTARCISALEQGFTAKGGETERIFLLDQKIGRCLQCEADGWGICKREGICIIKDDFQSVVDKVKAADVVVFATPVYFADLADSMRTFLDRLRRVRFGRTPPLRGQVGIGGAPAIALSLAGGGGGGAPTAALNLERILLGSGFDVVDVVNVRRQNFDMKLPILEMTGQWLAGKPTSEGGPER